MDSSVVVVIIGGRSRGPSRCCSVAVTDAGAAGARHWSGVEVTR